MFKSYSLYTCIRFQCSKYQELPVFKVIDHLQYMRGGGGGGSGDAMVLSKLSVPGRPANLNYSRARASALAVGADRSCLDIFSLIYHLSSFSLSLGDDPI